MTQPYFQNELVTLYHGDSFEVMASMADESVDCVITDPPFTERTHKGARKNTATGVQDLIHFDSFTEEKLHIAFEQLARVTKGWVVSSLDYAHAFSFDENPPKGLRQMRIGVWVKKNATPQISGDRPAQGWEAISYLHRLDKKAVWNGGGHHGNYVTNIPQATGHPTPKSLSMVSSLVERFSNPSDLIFDPFAGGGTTLLAARNLGRRVIGVELEEKYCELIANRLSQEAFDFGGI
jgi:site-specific DNA-methyltransferase (adenine-specific)